jgi:glycosyltransferase involved in cell wall biosynthesis
MIEAMACGTPVIARGCGSVPEVVDDGVTGFVASTVDELVVAVGKLGSLSRKRCRDEFERRFTVEIMVDQYEEVFNQLIEASKPAITGMPKAVYRLPANAHPFVKTSESSS